MVFPSSLLRVMVAFAIASGVAIPALAVSPPVPQIGPEVEMALDPAVPSTSHRVEPAIAVTPHVFGAPPVVHSHELVLINQAWGTAGSGYTEYHLSLDNGQTWSTFNADWPFPCSGTTRSDPMVAVSGQTGDLYIGGLVLQNFMVRRRTYGTAAGPFGLDVQILTTCDPNSDKGFLAMGPQPPGIATNVEAMYLGYTTSTSPAAGNLETVKAADTSYPAGDTWGGIYPVTSDAGQTARDGIGAYPVVISSGAKQGRLIMASSHTVRTSVPEVTYSDYGGDPTITPPGKQTWANLQALSLYSTANLPIFPTGNPPPLPGATNPPCFSSVSTDPTHPDRVYVIYPGLTSASGTNIDLFIARSYDAQSTAMTFLPENTIHITDTMLRLPTDCPGGNCPSETDEWLPSIVIDDLGGINIMFLRTQLQDSFLDPVVLGSEVRYARWSSDAQLSQGTMPFISSFGPSRFWTSQNSAGHDYHMIKASGCYVYATYSRGPFGSAPWRAYFRRILVGPCRADMIPNGVIGTEDFEAYLDAYIDAAPDADMDGDELVTTDDADTFFEAYCEGCSVPN